jgi:predicted histone-like DNA-binding protein
MAIPYRKRKKKILGPDHQLHEAWVMEQFSYEPVKFEDFVKECIMSQGVSGAQVKGIVEAMSNRLRSYLMLGHSVQIAGIGTLKPTFNAHSAETSEELSGKSVYKVKVQFDPHKDFQDVLSQMTFVDMDALNENPEGDGNGVEYNV